MKIQVLDAQKRFSSTIFGAGKDEVKTTYTCPNCLTKRIFNENEFARSLFKTNSCLEDIVIKEFDLVHPIDKIKWEDFLDFRCDNCSLNIRVIYTSNEYRMACHYFILTSVLEYSNHC
ncbi:hypothetical protein CPU12_00915 [Malaciobacter molluscorum LMG 25693]|uniref:Uncharacterized protein n=1 Tax=Malaciobacter molluscorum LMG 25693 TaxID=870501 RepID=A0A2G1DLM2_9BACT|nr:hypothetical protein [Malaciobacter molluscorum]AXX92140.1 hypothetical protein AMOL_1158 [Malaciobacter molluscorum LMG 25693]PHO19369.1 hypothetical protein CPU12_00915 [Malaciobacter molluscorum LMG 25693]